MAPSDFVSQFHNLEGDTTSQRKKNFFKLLKAQPVPLTDDDIQSLCPKTHLERQFQIDIFIHFKMFSKLQDVIKEGNELFISKILKHPSLLLEVIGNLSPEVFVNDFLPSTSYALRMKILKKIAVVLNEAQMDDIVSSVHKRYGFNIARKLIHTCSEKKIKYFLSISEVILSHRQVKFIFDKDPELFSFYVSYYKTLTGSKYNSRSVCRYVALRNPQMWLELLEEDIVYQTQLGHRTSKKFLRQIGDDLLDDVEYYSDFLKLDVIVRKLHGHFQEVYFEFFPKNIGNVDTSNFSHRLLHYYPKKKQWDMFAQTFLKVFRNDILDNLIHLNSNFIPLFPNKSVLNKWADVQYKRHKLNDLLKYCIPSKAIPLIKEKINVTSDINERKTLIILLLENCEKNEDLTTLNAVLKYICYRHRNEENTSDILQKIRYLFKLEEFNETHWNHILEMITIIKLRKQMNYSTLVVFLKYIEYLVLNGKPFRKDLVTYIKDVEAHGYSDFDINIKNPILKKNILTEIINVYRNTVEISDAAFNDKFIHIILNFNENNIDHNFDLSDFPGFLSYIQSLLNNDFKNLDSSARYLLIRIINYNFKFPEKPIVTIEEAQILKIFRQVDKSDFAFENILESSIQKLNRSKFENDILQFFFDDVLGNSEYFIFPEKILKWLLFNEPKTISPHFDRIWTFKQSYIKIEDIKLLSHLGFDKKVVDYCTNNLIHFDDFLKEITESQSPSIPNMEIDNVPEPKKEIDLDLYKNIIKYLSTLVTTDEYIEIISKRFLPIKEKVDIADEGLNEIYFLQCEVAGSLKHMLEPTIALPTVMKFCLGDYLQSALPSLYSICYRAPEKLLYSYMELLSKRAVSVRKHSLFLSCELLNFKFAVNRLQDFDERHVSSQKYMFSATLKYFRKNPCEELLDLVVINLKTIDKNDDETLKSLVNLEMPQQYKTKYIQKCWYFFEDLRKDDVYVERYLQLFFDAIMTLDKSSLSFPVDFYRHILTYYYRDSYEHDHNLNGTHRFACMILRNSKSEQVDNFNFIFDIISSFKVEAAKTFFDNFYDLAVDDIKDNNKIDTVNNYYIELFKQHWVSTFPLVKMFNEHVLLDLLYLKCKSTENIIENYAKGAVIYLEELIEEYGPFMYNTFKELVLHKNTFTNYEKYVFLYNILTFKNSPVNCMLVLDLLRYDHCHEHTIRETIMEILKNSEEPIISIHLNSYFS